MKKIIYILIMIIESSLLADFNLNDFENSRFSVDLTSRSTYNERIQEVSFQEFIGFDFHTFIEDNGQTIGEVVLQPYLYRVDSSTTVAPYYDDSHNWEVIFRTITFTFTGLGVQRPWFKIGHFELPFGLDHRKDTNGDLHQYSIVKATNLKIDWGLSMGQEFEHWYYETSLTRGSGVKYRDRENPYAITSRVAHDHDTWSTGLSFFSGEILKKKKLKKVLVAAIDYELYFGSYGLASELYLGQEDGSSVRGGLLEINWQTFDLQNLLYTQLFFKDKENNSTQSSIILGGEHSLTRKLSISAQVNFALSDFHSHDRQNVFDIQLRYRF
ncbi:MAG: hypothetical protein NE330_20070 [Lentisphaeraceae bacterium]|nr:hypothetical protein [Lentisphaeraceae bacterium]